MIENDSKENLLGAKNCDNFPGIGRGESIVYQKTKKKRGAEAPLCSTT
jgi:hypothetical protein